MAIHVLSTGASIWLYAVATRPERSLGSSKKVRGSKMRPGHGGRLILRHNKGARPPPSLRAPKAWKAVAAAAIAVLVLTPYLLFVRIGLLVADETLPETSINDICRVANAMQAHPLQFASYTAKGAHDPIGWPEHIPHVSSLICNRMQGGSSTDKMKREIITSSGTPVRSIFSFKSARSGSTFFTSVVTDVLKNAGRPTKKYWEPSFCSSLHKHSYGTYREASYQAESLRKMLTSNCTIDADFGCRPAGICQEEEEKEENAKSLAERGREPAYIVALNPRFLNQSIDWVEALGGMGDTLRIFSLRRTNLILMAYSKFHHGGCKVGKQFQRNWYESKGGNGAMLDEEELQENGMGGKRQFSFATMLKCIHHYAIGDQELSISTSFSAATASKSSLDPYIILYEDVLASGSIVQDGMLRHLGLLQDDRMGSDALRDGQAGDGNIFQNNRTATAKIHSDSLCSYGDVDCSELEAGLKSSRPDGSMVYPCLWKQYIRADEGLTWSMPLLRNGLVSLEGDCFPLDALDAGNDETSGKSTGTKRRARAVQELYRFS